MSSLVSKLSPESRAVPPSGIVEVFTYGWGRPGLIPLWAGEGDLPTPTFITEATTRSLAAGETFYTPNRGIPAFREAVARHMGHIYEREFSPDNFLCTIGGMHALQIAMRMVLSENDEVIIPSPAWPNFAGAAIAIGAQTIDVPMGKQGQGKHARWHLDLDIVKKHLTPRTRAIIINSPSNPTGWTATHDELKDILAFARHHGLWIIADEIYAQFVFNNQKRAASFHDIMAEDDQIMFIQTFSKNWAMTGWRIGWLECPRALVQTAENLIQYSSSGVPTFLQRGAIAAIDHGTSFVDHQIQRARKGLEITTQAFSNLSNIEFMTPEGAFYLYFKINTSHSSMDIAKDLVDRANVGLAPGTAFSKSTDAWLRLCFLRKEDDLHEAMNRLTKALSA